MCLPLAAESRNHVSQIPLADATLHFVLDIHALITRMQKIRNIRKLLHDVAPGSVLVSWHALTVRVLGASLSGGRYRDNQVTA